MNVLSKGVYGTSTGRLMWEWEDRRERRQIFSFIVKLPHHRRLISHKVTQVVPRKLTAHICHVCVSLSVCVWACYVSTQHLFSSSERIHSFIILTRLQLPATIKGQNAVTQHLCRSQEVDRDACSSCQGEDNRSKRFKSMRVRVISELINIFLSSLQERKPDLAWRRIWKRSTTMFDENTLPLPFAL